jgi:DNA repair protein RecN (Recombination protein N)
MLTKLLIKNYALIEDAEIDFKEGFTVITGETGAGKSILLGALSLILGNRADHSLFKDQSKKCIVEGYFNIKELDLKQLFKSLELDFEETSIIRREISATGKSRIFVNDTPTNLENIKLIGQKLIDIHSQNQSVQINKAGFKFELIDSIAGLKTELKSYQDQYFKLRTLESKLEKLIKSSALTKREGDFLKFQLEEIKSLNYKQGEELELEKEQQILANAEELIQTSNQAANLLLENEESLIQGLQKTKQLLETISNYNPLFKELSLRIGSSCIEVEDIAQEISSFIDDFEFNPNRLELLDDRLAEINRLKNKHIISDADELIELKVSIVNEISSITNADNNIQSLESKIENLKKDCLIKANRISEKRHKVFNRVSNSVNSSLVDLGIYNSNFKIQSERIEKLNEYGIETLDFLFSANKGVEPSKISKTASGGEVSRLMLSLKALLAENMRLPSILFDEIDTGVSGEIANKMGRLLQLMAKKRQVISITHLPQIASKGENHYFVYKLDSSDRTTSNLKELNDLERVEEIAKMLSGKNLTEAAINNAKELIHND